MAQKPPADKYFRDMPAVHMVFFASAVAMVAVIAWMSWDDYARDWKGYQRHFEKLERALAKEELKAAKARLDGEKIQQLQQDIAAEAGALKKNRVEYEKARAEHRKADADLYRKRTVMAFAKSDLDAGRYQYEEATRHGPNERALKKFEAIEKRHRDAREAFMRQETLVKTLEERVKSFTDRKEQLEKALERAQSEGRILAAKIDKLSPNPLKFLLNAPILDFVAPTSRIRQTVLPDLHDDYNFLMVEKVDRCHTCHLGIEKPSVKDADGNVVKLGYDDDNPNAPYRAQPFRAHPRLDLYAGAGSKHPVEKFGCSTCHAGVGHAVSFMDAGHTPKDGAQEAAWKKKYGYKPLDHNHLSDFLWDYMMYPGDLVEASCLKCHQGVVEIPEARALNAGRRLFEDYGCYGCHKTAGFTELRKPGPPLTHLQEKVSADWVKKWLKNPKRYRPTTRMPRFFDLSNTSSAEDVRRSDAEIAAITAFLYDRARPHTKFDAPPGAGDAKRGKELFETVGCLGCHSMTASNRSANDFGPDLGALGSKIWDRAWLFTWLRDPRRYFPHTKMPSLRLTDEEAGDIAAYLLSLKNAEFDEAPVPAGSVDDVDAILRQFWSAKETSIRMDEKLQEMPEKDKWIAAGEKLIGQYGCFGCHDIAGFEKTNPIGTELSEEGSKDLDKLDFGGLHLAHDRMTWFTQKLTDPRAFDQGKQKDRQDRLRMPNFDFTPDQVHQLVTHIFSMTKDQVRPERRRRLSAREEIVEKGRRLVRDHNCYGCHTVDGHEGGIRAYYQEDPGLAPPILFGQGRKVQEYWLYEFLKHPTTIRPWLKVRMPTFGFSDEEATAVVNYFQALDDVKHVYRPKDFHKPDAQLAAAGRDLFDKLQCMKCHVVGSQAPPGRAAGDLAPDLAMAKQRLNADWLIDWLSDPQKQMPGTRMPAFFAEGRPALPDALGGSAEKQIQALRDHVLSLR
ncbi:MAG: hypothetical protein A3G34_09480 [Candidatus Lindowbacteria bacterium RIFCSPLOWO2_12_FULL_62_27]|nr:MAG: hypothetical protein A3I06_08140 [Candidatus Lindowbacteria bacterium RIFCSPLOWO2_02_FULL_62_12]OGH60267.1 MAG: hypothetical protein A3G34_09480 [Candidatus Lindowbacteria bacterium RIFCSPLOWO2_12_FULL_62_27]